MPEDRVHTLGPIWCAVCDVSSDGGTYLAFIAAHAKCEAVVR